MARAGGVRRHTANKDDLPRVVFFPPIGRREGFAPTRRFIADMSDRANPAGAGVAGVQALEAEELHAGDVRRIELDARVFLDVSLEYKVAPVVHPRELGPVESLSPRGAVARAHHLGDLAFTVHQVNPLAQPLSAVQRRPRAHGLRRGQPAEGDVAAVVDAGPEAEAVEGAASRRRGPWQQPRRRFPGVVVEEVQAGVISEQKTVRSAVTIGIDERGRLALEDERRVACLVHHQFAVEGEAQRGGVRPRGLVPDPAQRDCVPTPAQENALADVVAGAIIQVAAEDSLTQVVDRPGLEIKGMGELTSSGSPVAQEGDGLVAVATAQERPVLEQLQRQTNAVGALRAVSPGNPSPGTMCLRAHGRVSLDLRKVRGDTDVSSWILR